MSFFFFHFLLFIWAWPLCVVCVCVCVCEREREREREREQQQRESAPLTTRQNATTLFFFPKNQERFTHAAAPCSCGRQRELLRRQERPPPPPLSSKENTRHPPEAPPPFFLSCLVPTPLSPTPLCVKPPNDQHSHNQQHKKHINFTILLLLTGLLRRPHSRSDCGCRHPHHSHHHQSTARAPCGRRSLPGRRHLLPPQTGASPRSRATRRRGGGGRHPVREWGWRSPDRPGAECHLG